MNSFLEIDGSMLEGGGQILRIAVSLSAILTVPIHVSRIRAGRSKPGLAAQHLVGIRLVADMCGAKLKGAHIGSMEISFVPGRRIRAGHYVADTRTAGSISLLLQVALPCALMANGPVTLDVKGGTNADMAPQIDYFNHIFMKNLNKFGVDVDLTVHRRGYYPKGGGHVTVQVEPAQKFEGIKLLDRGNFIKVFGWSFVAGTIPMKLAHQMVEGVKEQILPVHDFVEIQAYKEDTKTAIDNCSGLIIGCDTTTGCILGADGLGKRGIEALDVGRRAGGDLLTLMENGACVDEHAQDQIILYMALAEGKSAVRCGELTLHTRTAIQIAEMITKVRFTVHPEGDLNIIECVGMGFVNRHFDASHWGPPPNAAA